MSRTCLACSSVVVTAALVASVTARSIVMAAQASGVAAAPVPKLAAPIDLTGYWVSVVTEDWRWRMLTAPKGDYASVLLNPEGIKVANTWDPSNAVTDGCKAYGAAAVMRAPGRLRVTWNSDRELKIETDAGAQTRLLMFGNDAKPIGARTWQGHSIAEWETFVAFGQSPSRVGSLKVTTTNLRAGYLRKNGVPYSDAAVVTEHFDRLNSSGSEWLVVTTLVEDPRYLIQPFLTSTHFKREPDGAKWAPSPCERK